MVYSKINYSLLCGFSIFLILVGCASKKNILYLQDIESVDLNKDGSKNKVNIKPNDQLSIVVSSIDRKSAAPFNLPALAQVNTDVTQVNAQQRLQTYLVDQEGNIEFPILGVVNVGGKTTSEAILFFKKELKKYLKDPIINIRISNFKVSVLGEVSRPGVINVQDERITILEALSNAGDMTVFGKRKDVLVVREGIDKKEYFKVDFTSSEFINSPYYYLEQNDVVIVSPNKTQVQSSAFGRNTSALVSIAGVLISVITLLTR